MPHLVLVGDSILDNGAYTRGGPDVVTQVRALLPTGWKATLLAVDGSTTDHVAGQLSRLPKDATHLVLSVGGNNALMHLGILESPASSMAKSIETLAILASVFERRYRVAIAACLERCRVHGGDEDRCCVISETRSFGIISSLGAGPDVGRVKTELIATMDDRPPRVSSNASGVARGAGSDEEETR
jgi:hypothetical protein